MQKLACEAVKDIASTEDEVIEDLTARFIEAGVSAMAARILHSALKLFAVQGYAATSVREIVQNAGATNPMLYYYFGSKEGVFTRLLELMFSIIQTSVEAEIPAERTLYEKIHGIVSLHLEVLRERPIAVQFIYSVVFGPQHSGPSFNIVEAHHETFKRVERLFIKSLDSGELEVRPGFDAEFLAEQMIGIINNHLMRVLNLLRCASDEQKREEVIAFYLGEEAVERLVSFFLAGAGKLKECG